MFIKLLLLLGLSSFIYAKNYTLYIASSKYIEVIESYYLQTKEILNNDNLLVRTHEKPYYSLIISNIHNIKSAKKIQEYLKNNSTFKDSYIKSFNVEPDYNIILPKNKNETQVIKTNDISNRTSTFKQNIENSNDYITASIMYNSGQYKESYKLFSKLFLENNYNLNINYFLAKSAFNLKKYDEAIAAFERVLISNPNFNQARYDFAKALYVLKEKNEAKKHFEILLKSNIKEETKDKVKKFISILNKKKSKQLKGNINFLIGFNRSSNINNGLRTPQYRLPKLNNILVEGEKEISDSSHFEAINLNLFNYIKSKPIRIKNSFLIYNKNYFNEKEENITVFSYKPAIDYIYKKNLITLESAVERIKRKTNEDLLAFSFSPKYKNEYFSTYLKYQRIGYLSDINKEKDFEKYKFHIDLDLFKNVNLYFALEKDIRLKNLRTDIDKYILSNGINISYNLTPKNLLNFTYEFEHTNYKYKNIGFDTKRKDKNNFIEIGYKHNFNNSNIIGISATYTKNYSNQNAYLYDKKSLNLNYIKGFQW